MKNIILAIQIIILTITSGYSQENEIDEYLNHLNEISFIPGFSVVIVKDGKINFSKGYGVEYAGGSKAMTAQTSTAIGSLTKSFTALSVMQLVEKGEIELDEKVVKYLPWFRTANKEMSDKITVRMLINNTSGLVAPANRNIDLSDMAAENLARSLESVYLSLEPGSKYEYSNDGFAVAGLIVSKVSGLTFQKYVEENIFKPLKMVKTTTDSDKFEKLNVLYGHYLGIEKAIPIYSEESSLKEYMAAGSMLRSSANDIGNYLIALLNRGKFKDTQIISPESIDEMWKHYSSFPGISVDDGGENKQLYYGLGWILSEVEGKNYVFHGGNRRNMSSMTVLYPEKKIAASILVNADLTFIDKYKFPNLINIVNNVVRISNNEPESNFATPIVDDPTLNSYNLPDNKKPNYLGKYILTAGNDWVYLGSKLEISENPKGKLEVLISRGSQFIDQFEIDFISQKTAVSRNINIAQNLSFKIQSSGKISEVFFAGKKYSKVSEDFLNKFSQTTSINNEVSFYYPKNWEIAWSDFNFSASSNSADKSQIIGQIFTSDKSISQYFNELFPEHEILETGFSGTEILGSRFWNELAIVSENNDIQFQHLLFMTENNERKYFIVFTTQNGNLSKLNSNTALPLIRSFNWE
jgi:CubicO group peptidase (beta-lactamase class C family)